MLKINRRAWAAGSAMLALAANIVQEGIPAVIPPEACYLGWQESLAMLAQLVTPEIPG